MDVDPMDVPTGISTDSGGQPASAPGFNGNKTIGRLRTQGEPVHEPPAAESDKPQEKSGFQEFIDHEKHNVTEAAKHPWEAAKGAIKGTLNTVPALGDMVLKGGAYIYSTNAEQVAFALKNLGADGLSQSAGQSARSVSQAGQAVDLPKFQMSNAAQEGGDTIATVVTSVTGIAAVAKGGFKVVGKTVAKGEARVMAGAAEEIRPPGGGTVVRQRASPKLGEYKEVPPQRANEGHDLDKKPWSENSGKMVAEGSLSEDTRFVRYYDGENSKDLGGWMMPESEVRGLTPAQIKDKFALPQEPKFMTTVDVPAGTVIRYGEAGAINGWGQGGGLQVQLRSRIPVSNYAPGVPLQ